MNKNNNLKNIDEFNNSFFGESGIVFFNEAAYLQFYSLKDFNFENFNYE